MVPETGLSVSTLGHLDPVPFYSVKSESIPPPVDSFVQASSFYRTTEMTGSDPVTYRRSRFDQRIHGITLDDPGITVLSTYLPGVRVKRRREGKRRERKEGRGLPVPVVILVIVFRRHRVPVPYTGSLRRVSPVLTFLSTTP